VASPGPIGGPGLPSQLNQVLRDDAAEPGDMAQFLWCLSVLGASHPPVQREVARTGAEGVNAWGSFILLSKDTHTHVQYL
jgi:hypothetical protein